MTGAPAPDPTESEPTPFPEPLVDEPPAEIDAQALQDKLADIASVPFARTDPSDASLYYDAFSMAPLSPTAAVS